MKIAALRNERDLYERGCAFEVEDLRKKIDYFESLQIRKEAKRGVVQGEIRALEAELKELGEQMKDIDEHIIKKKRFAL